MQANKLGRMSADDDYDAAIQMLLGLQSAEPPPTMHAIAAAPAFKCTTGKCPYETSDEKKFAKHARAHLGKASFDCELCDA